MPGSFLVLDFRVITRVDGHSFVFNVFALYNYFLAAEMVIAKTIQALRVTMDPTIKAETNLIR